MPVIPPQAVQQESIYGHAMLVTWGPFATGDTFTAYNNAGGADRSVHVFGTFGGATVTVVGSNESNSLTAPTSLVALHDTTNAAISVTSAAIVQVQEVSNWIAPAVSGGAATGMTVALICRRTL